MNHGNPSSRITFCLLFLLSYCGTLEAQSSGSSSGSSSTTPSTTTSQAFLSPDAPQFWRDFRRFGIVAFGAFPFTFFISNFAVDTYRASEHDWDTKYAPWPLKSAGAINLTEEEFGITLGTAAAGAVFVAVVDCIIVQIKRHKAAQAAARLPKGEPIITRKPWPEGEGASSSEEAAP